MSAIAIDSETTGTFIKQGCRAFMLTACDDEGRTWEWNYRINPHTRMPLYDTPKGKAQTKHFLEVITGYESWVFHNSLFDLKVMNELPFKKGINFEELITQRKIHDTMVMGHANRSLDRLGLKPLAFQYLNYPEDDEKELAQCVQIARRMAKKLGWSIASEKNDHPSLRPLKKDYWKCDYWVPGELAKREPELLGQELVARFTKACSQYACGDVERTMGLFLDLPRKWKTEPVDKQKQYENNVKCVIPIRRMMDRGMRLNVDNIPKMLERLTNTKENIRKGIQNLIPSSSEIRKGDKSFHFNPRSSKQLTHVLFKDFKIEPDGFSDAGNPTTDKKAINSILDNQELSKTQALFLQRLLQYRKCNSTLNYLESYERFKVERNCNYYLYPNINPVGTTTTRVATREPNTQNVSKQDNEDSSLDASFNLREAFGPEKGKLWFAIDYAQFQLRIFAKVCGDKFLQESFEKGLDIHNAVACKIFNTKNPSSLQRRAAKAINFGIIFGAGRNRIRRECGIDGAFEEFKNQFPLVDRYLRKCEKQVRRHGYVLTPGGYPLYVQRRTAYKGANFVIQGSEGEIVKRAACYIEDLCYEDSSFPLVPIMTIHDEFLLETKNKMSLARFNSKYPNAMNKIADCMIRASADFDIQASVDAKVITTNWASGSPYPLTLAS